MTRVQAAGADPVPAAVAAPVPAAVVAPGAAKDSGGPGGQLAAAAMLVVATVPFVVRRQRASRVVGAGRV